MKFWTTSYGRPPPEPPPPPNLLSEDLLGNRDDYHKFSVSSSIRKRPNLVAFGDSGNYDSALHIAASANCSKSVEKFVKSLVSILTMEQLERQNKNHNTPLCIKAAHGSVESFKTMVIKNMALMDIPPDIPGSQGKMPLYMASLFENVTWWNCFCDKSNKMTGEFWTPLGHGWVLQKCVEADLFDGAEMGNTEFLVELIQHFLKLLWKKSVDAQTIFHVAVTHRHEGIYNLLHEIGSMKDMITLVKDDEGNNMLHLVRKTAIKWLQEVSGVLQMQRELVWFKEVEIADGAHRSTLCK